MAQAPKLPANPLTITPQKHGRNLTVAAVKGKYAGRKLTTEDRGQIERELEDLRAMDSYERHTSEDRELVKRELKRMLDRE